MSLIVNALDDRKRHRDLRPMNQESNEIVSQLLQRAVAAGLSYHMVGREIGVTERTVRRWATENNGGVMRFDSYRKLETLVATAEKRQRMIADIDRKLGIAV